jgi:hypothetical protein
VTTGDPPPSVVDRVVGHTVTLLAIEAERVDAYVRLADGRELGDALIAAGLAHPYDGGKRDGWCGQ